MGSAAGRSHAEAFDVFWRQPPNDEARDRASRPRAGGGGPGSTEGSEPGSMDKEAEEKGTTTSGGDEGDLQTLTLDELTFLL